MNQLLASGGQSIGASASASVLPMNIQGCFSSGLTGLISLQSNGLSRIFSSTTVLKHQFFVHQPFFMDPLSHPYMKVKVKSLSRVRLFCDPMDCSLPGSSVHGIFQARVLEWVAISFSEGVFPGPGIEPASPALAGGFFTPDPPENQ